ncbi:MAG: DUF4058 family protein [Chloroflexaceae bacterium]|nr:DUF4058 family protein [Chloroflexaceae bacterium]
METPFPGMDPYLEAPAFWPDVHNRLAYAICDQIQPTLSPRYAAIIVPYSTFETIDIAPAQKVVPDIGLIERDLPGPGGTAVATLEAPLTSTITLEMPTRYARIEIRTVGNETLVTAIELLSPVNKRPGAEGAEAYERKRREVFRSDAHLLEIDLLRAGKRPAFQTELPDSPYFVYLSRAERRPTVDIWPMTMQAPMDVVPVPLRYPDPDVRLDLNAALHQAYTSARYDLRLDYRNPPPPPELSPDDAAWLDAHLRERGLR